MKRALIIQEWIFYNLRFEDVYFVDKMVKIPFWFWFLFQAGLDVQDK